MDIPNIYGDPILTRARKGTAISPYKEIKEDIFIDKGYALLSEIPTEFNRVKVTGLGRNFYEVKEGFLDENTYKVDYTNGVVYLHESLNEETLQFEYMGRGVFLFPDSRVYVTDPEQNFINVRDKFTDVDRSILVQKNRVDTLIRENPQPSEVVDMRVDYNGKIFPVAKDRIDSEQQKIEEAYVDANGKEFDSLKLRIDSLQKATEEDFDEQDQTNNEIWSEIELIPGQITLEVGRLEEKVDGDVALLQSQIDMVPEQISLEVQELREYTDDELDYAMSQINLLSDEIDLKVDVNGVVSSINLSEEGVAIEGDKVQITGETHIDDAVIKSAMIDDLDAGKISTGILKSANDNTHFNLDTGELDMENANFEMSSGARIYFNDGGNKIVYQRHDYEEDTYNSAGFGVGTNINDRFPFVYMGTTSTSRGSLGAYDGGDFTGFIANTQKRMDVDNIGNSVVGDYFHIRDEAVSYSKGFRFELDNSGGGARVYGMNVGRHFYDLGTASNRFNKIYGDHYYGDSFTFNYPYSGSDLGYKMEVTLTEAGGDRNPAFRPQYGGRLYYNLGTSYHVWRRGYINVLHYNALSQNSLREYKEDFNTLDTKDALDYVKNTEVQTFYYKHKEDRDGERTLYDMKVGIVHDDINLEKDYLVKSSDSTVDQSNIVYMIQAATKNLIERVEKLEKENKELKNELR